MSRDYRDRRDYDGRRDYDDRRDKYDRNRTNDHDRRDKYDRNRDDYDRRDKYDRNRDDYDRRDKYDRNRSNDDRRGPVSAPRKYEPRNDRGPQFQERGGGAPAGPRGGGPGCGSQVPFPNSEIGTCDSCGKKCRVGSHTDVQSRKCCTGCWDRWWSDKDRNVRSALMASERDALRRRVPCPEVEWNAVQVQMQNTFVQQYCISIEKDENVREVMRKKLILAYLRCVLDKEYLRTLDIIVSGNVFYCIEDIRDKLQEPLLREVSVGSFKTTMELRMTEQRQVQLNPRNNEEQSLQVYNHVLGRILESLGLKRSGRVYCDETRQRVYRDMIVVPGYFATLQVSDLGVILIVHPRTRVHATMTALDWMKRSGFTARDLIGRKVLASYGTKQRQYVVYKIDKDSSPESTFELKSGVTISYAQYYLDNYGLAITNRNQPLLWGERSGRVRLVPELVLVDQLSSEARRFLPTRCSKMPSEIHNECTALADRLKESAPKALFATYGLSLVNTKLLMVKPKLLKPVSVNLCGVNESLRPHADFAPQTLRISMNEERKPFQVFAWGDRARELINRIIDVNERIRGTWKLHGGVQFVGGHEESSDFIDNCIDSVKTSSVRDQINAGIPVFVLCVLNNGHSMRGMDAYGTLKYELGQLGIISHFVDHDKMSKTRSVEPYIHNITKNITSKMGTPLWNVDLQKLVPSLTGGTLYIGYDVFSDRRSDATDNGSYESQRRNLSGYVAWFQRSDGKWLHLCKTDMNIERQKTESTLDGLGCMNSQIDSALLSLREFVEEALSVIVASESLTRIVVYRDGVGDSMMDRVRSEEMRVLESSLPPNVSLTFMVVQKRIHDRYTVQMRVGPNIEWHNIPRGHVVEHSDNCFSCIAVDCTLATAKPVKYFILSSGGLETSEIHNLTYALCWMYQNWPGSIKVPFVLQCAHKLAFFHGTSSMAKPNVELGLRKMPYYL